MGAFMPLGHTGNAPAVRVTQILTSVRRVWDSEAPEGSDIAGSEIYTRRQQYIPHRNKPTAG